MRVIIVAKTRMGSGACVGGITSTGRSVRLIAADKDVNERFNMEYEVGDVWRIEFREADELVPPHIENIVVHSKEKLKRRPELDRVINRFMRPAEGGFDELFQGMTGRTKAGSLYVAERIGIPPFSTMFWRPDQDLTRDLEGKRIRYRYGCGSDGPALTFVGFQEPVDRIPAGTLLRVSLAHWWRAEDKPDDELRCYVQLSGWIGLEGNHVENLDRSRSPEEVRRRPRQDDPAYQSSEVQKTLSSVFGYDSFRPLQQDIIRCVLRKWDSLAVMPTGSGKSLCYQLPALLFPGLTVVVSPLIALMEDQVMQLTELGIPAVYLNSTLTYGEYIRATRRIQSGEVKLLYSAPETLLRPETLALLERCQVDCLTIDEAHCISEWGHDFRPEYRQLAELRRRLPAAVCLAVTATATSRVRQDILTSLAIPSASQFIGSFNRENLVITVRPKHDGLGQLLEFLEEHHDQPGIIYCTTKKSVDVLCAELHEHHFNALPYHAGLDSETRRENQYQFIRDDLQIIVATIAFGMGINHSGIRFVVHYDLPKSIESYYQQIGRAGRDGLRADCLLLFSFGDVKTIQFLNDLLPASQRMGAEARLQSMIDLAETQQCRRRPLLAYFGESYEPASCGACDNCMAHAADPEALEDLTIPAQKFLSCVRRTHEIYGASYIVNVLRGSRQKVLLQRGHDRLPTHGIGKELSRKAWRSLARQLVCRGALEREPRYGSLKITELGERILHGERFFGLPIKDLDLLRVKEPAAEYDVALFEVLRKKRKAIAGSAGIPPYMVFNDRSLMEMATYYPQSRRSFSCMFGVGRVKLERYADEFLPPIRQYCQDHNLIERSKKPHRKMEEMGEQAGAVVRRKPPAISV